MPDPVDPNQPTSPPPPPPSPEPETGAKSQSTGLPSNVAAAIACIPLIGGILVFFWAIIAALVHLVFLVIMIITIVKAFTGVRWEIPYIGPIARKQLEGGAV